MQRSVVRVLTVGSALVVIAGLTGPALAAGGGSQASGWQIGYYTPSPKGTLSYSQASQGSGEAALNFTSADNTALLITGQKAEFPSLLGNLSGATKISTNFTVSNVTGVFTYFGEPSCGGLTAMVRFYFQTSSAGGFNETHFWWSNPVSYPLTTNASNQMLSSLFGSGSGAVWSDYFGHFGNNPSFAAGFQSALANVTDIGMSFGGGCFFENGVGTTDGSGTFTINSFTVS